MTHAVYTQCVHTYSAQCIHHIQKRTIGICLLVREVVFATIGKCVHTLFSSASHGVVWCWRRDCFDAQEVADQEANQFQGEVVGHGWLVPWTNRHILRAISAKLLRTHEKTGAKRTTERARAMQAHLRRIIISCYHLSLGFQRCRCPEVHPDECEEWWGERHSTH